MIEITVKEPYFSYIKKKKKIIEGRLNTGKFSLLKKGDILKMINGDDEVIVKVKKIKKYSSFEEYLSLEGLIRTLPNIKKIIDGINIYRKFYSEENEKKYGILAIYIKKIN